MPIPIYQVDAFTDNVFKGNPAAVCPLDEWLQDSVMQNIAGENNLAETAFFVKKQNSYEIRWFTPTIEVDLCGHATLASAYVIFKFLKHQGEEIIFHTKTSGILTVNKKEDLLTLDFPADDIKNSIVPAGLKEALGGVEIEECYKGKTDYLLILADEQQVENLEPDMQLLSKIPARGIIVSARGEKYDFVSRFFGPQVGVPEDPVTGSAHTTLIPFWAKRLGKNKLYANQLSKRQGVLTCELIKDRVKIGGKAVLYLQGEINI